MTTTGISLRSMTGYARSSVHLGEVRVDVEVKSVNHRFLDLSLKLPGQYLFFEAEVTRAVKERIARGRVDLVVQRVDNALPSYEMRYNSALFGAYWDAIGDAAKRVGVDPETFAGNATLQILARREVLDLTPVLAEGLDERESVLAVIAETLDRLLQMRAEEGEILTRDITNHLAQLEKFVEQIASQTGALVIETQARIKGRIEKLLQAVEVDQNRLVQELAILADRTDVTEEITRLRSHCQQFRSYLQGEQPGKKLEFLLQEIGRELNTCGSKVQNATLQTLVVEGKAAAEKIREQLLNIE